MLNIGLAISAYCLLVTVAYLAGKYLKRQQG